MNPSSSPDQAPGDLAARMAAGTAWVVAMRVGIRALGVLSMIILARLLVPSDYGLIALATVLAAAIELLSEFNFEVWLIRLKSPEREQYDTVWTLSLVRGAVTAVLLLLCAAPMGDFYGDPRLSAVIQLLALGIMLASAKNVGVVEFQKELHFDREFVFNGSVKLGAFVVTVALGFLLRSYWALLAGILTGHALQFLLSYRMHGYRPRLSLACWREAVGFSKWLLVGNVLSFVHMRADTFILGKLAGGQILGLYTVAREIANLATTELVMPVRRVMLPGYAKLQSDIEELRHAFVRDFGLIVLVGTPVAIGISVAADPLVRVFLGPRWLTAIPILEALALYGFAMIGMANQWPALVAVGRTRVVTGLLALGLVVLLPSLYVGSERYGAVGAALALGLSNLLVFVGGLALVRHALALRWRDLWHNVWRSLAATAVMAATVTSQLGWFDGAGLPAILALPVAVITGAVSYLLALAILWRLQRPVASPEAIAAGFLSARIAAMRGSLRRQPGE